MSFGFPDKHNQAHTTYSPGLQWSEHRPKPKATVFTKIEYSKLLAKLYVSHAEQRLLFSWTHRGKRCMTDCLSSSQSGHLRLDGLHSQTLPSFKLTKTVTKNLHNYFLLLKWVMICKMIHHWMQRVFYSRSVQLLCCWHLCCVLASRQTSSQS